MPPGRRGRPPGPTSTSSRRDSNAQSTLAFGNRNNKITKPSKPTPATGKKHSGSVSPSIKQNEDVIKAIDDEPVKAPQVDDTKDDEVVNEAPILAEGREQELAIRQSQQKKEETKKDEAREKAGKISDAAVRRYWHDRENERKAPRGSSPLSHSRKSLSLHHHLADNPFPENSVHQQAMTLHDKILRHFDLSSQYGPCVGVSRSRRWKRAEGLGLEPPIEVLAVLIKEEGGGKKGKGMDRAFMDGLLGGSAVMG
ncbi:MAG: hypothetical protein Q9212_002148 [Teloschistes hypoglaucus]